MIRSGGLRGSALCSKAGRRLCHILDLATASAAGATNGEHSPKPVKKATQPARLWAMQRVCQKKFSLNRAMNAWRIPACLDASMDPLPQSVGRLLYLDRLQVHQFYWKLGDSGFMCTKFCMDIYDPSWERHYADSTVVASFDVYPHMVNKNEENDIINLVLVSPKQWGMRSPIHFSGEQHCMGTKKGGIFKKKLTYITFDCDFELLAPKIFVDVSNLDIGEQVLIQDLNLNLELRWNLKPSTVVCEVLPGSNEGLFSCEKYKVKGGKRDFFPHVS